MLLDQNLPVACNTFCISSCFKNCHFHTKAYFAELLKNCNDLISASIRHCQIVVLGLSNDTVTVNHLINCYVRLHRVPNGHQLLDEMPKPNVVSWTSLIAGYINEGKPEWALSLFRKMSKSSAMRNDFTFATAINACSVLASLKFGRKIHAHVEILGFKDNLVVCSSLIDMYGKCNAVDDARRVFDSMVCKNVISWTSMVSAYTQSAKGHEALQLFREFNYSSSENLNHYMLASVISGCASVARLVAGKAAHGSVIRHSHDQNDVVASALVDMYAKCGCIEYSGKVFRRIQVPSVISYTSMIVSAAKYGLGEMALDFFQEMIDKGLEPNDVTFVGVLHACSHAGLVDEGLRYLATMHEKHRIAPDAKHYACVVDMLGRTGRLEEAYKLAKVITVLEPDQGALMWGTLLSASRLHGRLDIAVETCQRLLDSNQQVAGAYVTLSNAYASAGDLEKAHGLRAKMKHTGVYKKPGCSWLEIRDLTYVFHAGDVTSCARSSEVLSVLRELEGRIKERGYEARHAGLVFIDVEEEAREEIVGLHSERLALGFGLISVPKGVTIRIMKNLRMCRDCHEAFKMFSEVVERNIVVRDVNRFHHFKNGSCTCRDFW